MEQKESKNYTQFIDADEDYGVGEETAGFEKIVINQIQECAKVLSMEARGGYLKQTKNEQVYVEDTRELGINSVDTLRMLLGPFMEKKDEEKITLLYEELKTMLEQFGEKSVVVAGQGVLKIKDMRMLHVEHPILKEIIEGKYRIYRKIFGVLVKIYYERKQEIAALSIDE